MADTPFDIRLASESSEAFHAFSIYRDLGLKRNLDEVSRRLDAEKRGSGLHIVRTKEARTKHRKSGKIGLWSRKYHWVERAAAWDCIVDQRLREKQLDEIEKMAKRQAQEAQVLSQILMAPVVALASGLKDPNRARTLENTAMAKLLEMCFESAKAIPRVHKAERLARGVKVIDTDPVSNPGSAQGGAEWRLTVYQPERKEPLPDRNTVNATEPEEWEE
ncbi:MAG: hypothetical protein ACR2IV_01995 [Bryobacteraceae bacterium]